ncbi:hypothetical protein SAMN05660479_02378 [Microbulbifer thermotolerans]|nr:hypothetical protein SAMN05660479_02378 [Microbulbifer thermotolerans]
MDIASCPEINGQSHVMNNWVHSFFHHRIYWYERGKLRHWVGARQVPDTQGSFYGYGVTVSE